MTQNGEEWEGNVDSGFSSPLPFLGSLSHGKDTASPPRLNWLPDF